MTEPLHSNLVALGNSAVNKPLYEAKGVNREFLEKFPSPFAGPHNGRVKIEAPEFTSLCPLTGQPDFAEIIVEYQPNEWCVESKAFKLYLGSYRNQGEFHESIVNRITLDLVDLLHPAWLQVEGRFTPRGGIKFWPTCTYYDQDEE